MHWLTLLLMLAAYDVGLRDLADAIEGTERCSLVGIYETLAGVGTLCELLRLL
jgi:hypothetical protein